MIRDRLIFIVWGREGGVEDFGCVTMNPYDSTGAL